MEHSNNFGITVVKLTFLTTIIIWCCIIYDGFTMEMLPYLLLSTFLIVMVWSLIILCTIMPFFWFSREKNDKNIIFHRYFPFYAIVLFLFFFVLFIAFNMDKIAFVFFAPIFYALMLAWVWLCKPNNLKNKKIS